MKSETINVWNAMVQNPPDSFKKYFDEEKKFIENNILKDDTVLDLGCGTGRTIKIISKISKKVIGIDNDKDAVNTGKKNIKELKNAELILEDAEKMHFENNSFDIVFIGLSFVNFGKTKYKILEEIKRILKDNGKLIFSVYNENALDERLKTYKKFDKRDLEISKEGTIKFDSEAISEQFSKEEIRAILKKAGFQILEIKKGEIFYLIKAKK